MLTFGLLLAVLVYEVHCTDCSFNCTNTIKNICATDGKTFKTFPNICYLAEYNCLNNVGFFKKYYGPCYECPNNCSEYNTNIVCAQRKNRTRSFKSECEVNAYNCKHQLRYKIVFQGDCQDRCNFSCKNDQEVCATDGTEFKTFQSPCQVGEYNCEHNIHFNITELKHCTENRCKQSCAEEVNPICGKYKNNFRSFTNMCYLNSYNCLNKGKFKYKVVYKGSCKETDLKNISIHKESTAETNENSEECTTETKENNKEDTTEINQNDEKGIRDTNQNDEKGEKETNHNYEKGIKDTNQNDENGIKATNHKDEKGIKTTNHKDEKDIKATNYKDKKNIKATNHKNEKGKKATNHKDEKAIKATNYNDEKGKKATNHKDEKGTKATNHKDEEGIKATNHKDEKGIKATNHNDEKDTTKTSQNNQEDNTTAQIKIYQFKHKFVTEKDKKDEPDQVFHKQQINTTESTIKYPEKEIQVSKNTNSGEDGCSNLQCPTALQPICAQKKNQRNSFINICFLKAYNCLYPKTSYKKLHDGICLDKIMVAGLTSCPKVCPKKQALICGKDSKGNKYTFRNLCNMELYNCQNIGPFRKLYKGKCLMKRRQIKRCKKSCLARPKRIVCVEVAGEYRTMKTNECLLKLKHCKENISMKVLYNGRCRNEGAEEDERDEDTHDDHQFCPNSPSETQIIPSLEDEEAVSIVSVVPAILVSPSHTVSSAAISNDGSAVLKACPTKCEQTKWVFCVLDDHGMRSMITNPCELRKLNCLQNTKLQIIKKHACEVNTNLVPQETKCRKSCSVELKPVCGKSEAREVVFLNDCHLKRHNCLNKKQLIRMDQVPCSHHKIQNFLPRYLLHNKRKR